MHRTAPDPPAAPAPVDVWGVPVAPLTFTATLDAVDRLRTTGVPAYFITANLHYAMLTDADPRLDAVNRDAAFVLADGMPLVWAARLAGRRVPERVAGSDLVPALCERAARRAGSVFLLGGAAGVAVAAGAELVKRFPGLRVVGVESPPFRPPTPDEHAALLERIRAARPDLLFVAFGQPKGELWVHAHFRELGVPMAAQIGASLDMLVGRVRRAPRWVQRTGFEWVWRIGTEPRRLAPRYAADAWFLLRALLRQRRR